MSKLSKIRTQVETVLRDHPDARDDYKLLVKYVYESRGLFLTEEQLRILKTCPTSESITRNARMVWQSHKYLPSQAIREKRHMAVQDYREEMKYRIEFDNENGVARKVAIA